MYEIKEYKIKREIKFNLYPIYKYFYIFIIFLILSFITNQYLISKIKDDAIKRNHLIIKKASLHDEFLLCKAFSINTRYLNSNDCKIISSNLKQIKKELSQGFKLLDFYIKHKGVKIETKKNI